MHEPLRTCCTAVLAAPNGHAKRWAVARCANTLARLGTSPGNAQRTAQAMRTVAEHLLASQQQAASQITATLLGPAG